MTWRRTLRKLDKTLDYALSVTVYTMTLHLLNILDLLVTLRDLKVMHWKNKSTTSLIKPAHMGRQTNLLKNYLEDKRENYL